VICGTCILQASLWLAYACFLYNIQGLKYNNIKGMGEGKHFSKSKF